MYYGPKLDKNNFSREMTHRGNLLGDKISFKDRLMYIFEINESAFTNNNFGYALESILSNCDDIYTNNVAKHEISIKKILINKMQIPKKFLCKKKTKHHIIFQNEQTGGHQTNKNNLVKLESGLHSSYHELLNHEMLLPHQQFSKVMLVEKEYLQKCIWETLIAQEKECNERFRKNPFEIYKKQCFRK